MMSISHRRPLTTNDTEISQMATKTIPTINRKAKELRLVRNLRVETEVMLATISRWLAKQEVKAQHQGRKWDAVALANATTAYLIQHRTRLRTEAKLILSSSSEETL
jgi:hypothetical protein